MKRYATPQKIGMTEMDQRRGCMKQDGNEYLT